MPENDVIITDGSIDFSGGVNSIKTTTIQSERNPNGLARNELAWLDNATVRDGGITCRSGWIQRFKIAGSEAKFQGKFMYEPSGQNPYMVYQISGHIIMVDPDTGQIRDLTLEFPANAPQFNPTSVDEVFFVQAEKYLIIQAGDGTTLPFFWDGTTLRRSVGIISATNTPSGGVKPYNELPAATAMDYFMGRVFCAQGRQVMAGDIVGGPSGTLPTKTDAVLKVTENPFMVGGDGFTIPSNDGTIIRGIKHSANIDTALGQGRLFVGTRKAIYALNVPVTRTDWIAATSNNQPLMTVVQLNNGWVNDRSIVAVNGDLFYQSLEPGIRSLLQAMRYFNQWGNIQISANEQRILQYNDRALLRYGSGIYFDNRLLETALPYATPQGVAHKALVPLDFIPVSSFNRQKEPNWEGMYEGLNILQMATGDFGGRERAFATVVSSKSEIELWEITSFAKFDVFENKDNRVTWIIETPAFTWGSELDLKKLVGAEIWVDRLFGDVQFVVQYRPDGQACWIDWHAWKKCSTKNSDETVLEPAAYPKVPCLESYFSTMSLPKPPAQCTVTIRPSDTAYQFQVRLTIRGFCRIRGIYLHAQKVGRKLYDKLTC